MRKSFQRQLQVPFLPNISQSSSRRETVLTFGKNAKENTNDGNSVLQKFKMEATHRYLVKKNSFVTPSTPPSPIEDIINKKMLEKNQIDTDVPTQPKGNRPWLAYRNST